MRSFCAGLPVALLLATSVCPVRAQQPFRMPPPELAEPLPGGIRVTDSGLVGNWYAGSRSGTARHAAVLLLGGSEGGIGSGAARQAADFAANGFAVLQLAYFGAPGLSPKLDRVPLEYFDKALAWIERQPGVDPQRVAVVGASKGAEAALLIATRHPELHSVVVGAPSAAVWPGIDFTGGRTGSSWTIGGKSLPYLQYGAGAKNIFDGYRSGLATLSAHGEAAIPVARIAAKVMLVCGRADSLWPSCPMASRVLRDLNSEAVVLAYEGAGHAVFGPPVATDASGYRSLASLGGTSEQNNRARADAWPKVLAFIGE